MQARVQRWGNGLAIRIPQSLADQSQIDQNSIIEMSVENGRIILLPVAQRKVTLTQLLEGVTKENLHQAVETGPSVGQEVW